MSNYLSKIIPSVMISASALTGCEQPQQPRTTLNNYMANRPAKEYIAIKNGWREGIGGIADAQHSLDSVAYTRLFESTQAAKDSAKVAKFNKIAASTKLESDRDKTALKELDAKLLQEGITLKDYQNFEKELKSLKELKHGIIEVSTENDYKNMLKLKQFKLDSLVYGHFFEKEINVKAFIEVAKKIKPRRP